MSYLERNKWIYTFTIALMILMSGLMARELGVHVPIMLSYIVSGLALVVCGIQAYFTDTLSSKLMQYTVLAVVVLAAVITIYRMFF